MQPARKANKVLPGLKAIQDRKVRMGPRAKSDPPVRRGLRDRKAMRDHRDLPDPDWPRSIPLPVLRAVDRRGPA